MHNCYWRVFCILWVCGEPNIMQSGVSAYVERDVSVMYGKYILQLAVHLDFLSENESPQLDKLAFNKRQTFLNYLQSFSSNHLRIFSDHSVAINSAPLLLPLPTVTTVKGTAFTDLASEACKRIPIVLLHLYTICFTIYKISGASSRSEQQGSGLLLPRL